MKPGRRCFSDSWKRPTRRQDHTCCHIFWLDEAHSSKKSKVAVAVQIWTLFNVPSVFCSFLCVRFSGCRRRCTGTLFHLGDDFLLVRRAPRISSHLFDVWVLPEVPQDWNFPGDGSRKMFPHSPLGFAHMPQSTEAFGRISGIFPAHRSTDVGTTSTGTWP